MHIFMYMILLNTLTCTKLHVRVPLNTLTFIFMHVRVFSKIHYIQNGI